MLEYDDSAFYYFSITFLVLYAVPATYYLIFHQIFPALAPGKDPALTARTSAEKKKAKALAETKGVKRLYTIGFLVQVVVLLAAYCLIAFLIVKVWQDHEIAQFDPYVILDIPRDAPDKVIRKAYRALSLKWHPDKNPGNQFAEDMFMKVRKAYEALTDEVAKENWQKYGNPDGKQALEVSIGLPTFLLDKDNHTTILLAYLIVLVVLIPLAVGCWYSESKQYGEKNIMYQTYTIFFRLLTEHTTTKFLPEIFVMAVECLKLNRRKPDDVEDLKRVQNKLSDRYTKPRHDKLMKDYVFEISKGNLLLQAHVNRVDVSPSLQKDLNAMLRYTDDLVDAMIEIVVAKRWLQTMVNVIEFQQMLIQGIWVKDNALLQLPHFTDKEVGHVLKGKGSIKTIGQYIALPDDQKKGLADFTEEQKEDVLEACKIIPTLEVTHTVTVEDEEIIAENDLLTVTVTITRTNLPETCKRAPLAHAPNFPFPREDGFWVILANNSIIIVQEHITDRSRTVSTKLQFQGPNRAGDYSFDLYVMSDTYVGISQQQDIICKVVPASEVPEYKPHPADLALDNEPTLFESLAGNVEDSESDDEPEPAQEEAKADGGPQRRASRQSEDDEEEEEEEEEDGGDGVEEVD